MKNLTNFFDKKDVYTDKQGLKSLKFNNQSIKATNLNIFKI